MLEILTNLPKEVIVFLVSMLPVGELRVAIPLAITKYNMGFLDSYIWAVLGNIVPVVFIILFLERTSVYLSHRVGFFRRFFEWLFERTRKKHSKKFELYEELALVLFVAIPLPMTGGWSGAIAAFVFGIPPKKAIPLVILGVMIAGIIVTILSLGYNFIS